MRIAALYRRFKTELSPPPPGAEASVPVSINPYNTYMHTYIHTYTHIHIYIHTYI